VGNGENQKMKERPGLRRISPWWTIGGLLTIRERLSPSRKSQFVI